MPVTTARPWTPAELETVRRLRLAGLPLKAIRRRVGRDPRRALRRLGLTARRPGRGVTRRRVVRLYRRGHSGRAIADRLGIAPATVNQHLRNAGLARGPDSRAGGRAAAAAFVAATGETFGRYLAGSHRAESVMAGWPPVGRRTARLLGCFEAGPLTAAGLAVAAGLTPASARQAVGRLRRAGHLIRAGYGPGRKRGRVPLFALAPTVAGRRRQALAYRSEDVPA